MKKLIMICALMALFGSTAKADNPASWDFDLTIYRLPGASGIGAPDAWHSNTNIDPGYPRYNVSWQFTTVEIQVIGNPTIDILDDIPAVDRSGSLPPIDGIPFVDELILHIEWLPQISAADFYLTVDTGGFGTISMEQITLGSHPDPSGNVQQVYLEGNVEITAVPEPATIALLALGGLALMRNRSRMRRFPTSVKTGSF